MEREHFSPKMLKVLQGKVGPKRERKRKNFASTRVFLGEDNHFLGFLSSPVLSVLWSKLLSRDTNSWSLDPLAQMKMV